MLACGCLLLILWPLGAWWLGVHVSEPLGWALAPVPLLLMIGLGVWREILYRRGK